MNLPKFFDTVRTAVFGGRLNSAQVDGLEALLDACTANAVVDLRHVAYVLATPMIETGGSYVPITESLNYSALALTSKFPRRITPAQAAQYGRTSTHETDQQAIGNLIYGGGWVPRTLATPSLETVFVPGPRPRSNDGPPSV